MWIEFIGKATMSGQKEAQLTKEDMEKWSVGIDHRLQEQDRVLLESGALTREDFA